MKLFFKRVDGGPRSNVTGYWLIEWKRAFSIALLRFSPGSRDCYHSHAFNCLSWILRGRLREYRIDIIQDSFNHRVPVDYTPSLRPVITTRDNTHLVFSYGTTWALTFRGPWAEKWHEWRQGRLVTLTNGRKEVA